MQVENRSVNLNEPETDSARAKLFWSYGIIGLAVVVFSIATAYGLYQYRKQSDLVEYNSQAALWLVVSFEREYQKLNSMMWQYQAANDDLNRDDLLIQYDVFWSRINLMREGGHAKPLERIQSYSEAVPAALSMVTEHEAAFFDAVSNGRPLPLDFLREFRAQAEKVHRFLVDTHIDRAWVAKLRENEIRNTRHTIYLTLAGALFSTLMLFVIVIMQLKGRRESLGQTVAALQQSEKDRMALGKEVHRRRLAEQERKQLVLDLEARNEELERYAYTISHDLKSPLFTIQGFTGYLKQDVESGNKARMTEDIDNINAAVTTMSILLDDILKLSRFNQEVESKVVLSLEEMVENALAMVSGEIRKSGSEVQVNKPLPQVVAEPSHVVEVIQNLVSNAIKFMGDQKQPRIEIGARAEGGWVHCYVLDNGIGIEPRYYDRVFNLFERLQTRTEGSGVGLAIVKRIIERHGGRVMVSSEGLEKGSRFEFTLPDAGVDVG